jgi:hypothetical protein
VSEHCFQPLHVLAGKCSRDQQDAIRAQRARFEDLIGLGDEVLAQHRQRAGRARLRQVLGLPGKNPGRSAPTGRRPRPLVAARDRGRIEIGAQQPLEGLACLTSAITAGAGGDLCAQRADEIARRRRGRGAALHLGKTARARAASSSSRLRARMRSRMSAQAISALRASW